MAHPERQWSDPSVSEACMQAMGCHHRTKRISRLTQNAVLAPGLDPESGGEVSCEHSIPRAKGVLLLQRLWRTLWHTGMQT